MTDLRYRPALDRQLEDVASGQSEFVSTLLSFEPILLGSALLESDSPFGFFEQVPCVLNLTSRVI